MTVYVTQEVANVNYAPAAVFGDIVFITSSNDKISSQPNSLNNRKILDDIEIRLKDFKPSDYLVCTGSPALMAICGAKLHSRLQRLLVWDNREYSYFEVKL